MLQMYGQDEVINILLISYIVYHPLREHIVGLIYKSHYSPITEGYSSDVILEIMSMI